MLSAKTTDISNIYYTQIHKVFSSSIFECKCILTYGTFYTKMGLVDFIL